MDKLILPGGTSLMNKINRNTRDGFMRPATPEEIRRHLSKPKDRYGNPPMPGEQYPDYEEIKRQQNMNPNFPLERGPHYLPEDGQDIPNQLERRPYYPGQEGPKGYWLPTDPPTFVPAEQDGMQQKLSPSNEKIRRMSEILKSGDPKLLW